MKNKRLRNCLIAFMLVFSFSFYGVTHPLEVRAEPISDVVVISGLTIACLIVLVAAGIEYGSVDSGVAAAKGLAVDMQDEIGTVGYNIQNNVVTLTNDGVSWIRNRLFLYQNPGVVLAYPATDIPAEQQKPILGTSVEINQFGTYKITVPSGATGFYTMINGNEEFHNFCGTNTTGIEKIYIGPKTGSISYGGHNYQTYNLSQETGLYDTWDSFNNRLLLPANGMNVIPFNIYYSGEISFTSTQLTYYQDTPTFINPISLTVPTNYTDISGIKTVTVPATTDVDSVASTYVGPTGQAKVQDATSVTGNIAITEPVSTGTNDYTGELTGIQGLVNTISGTVTGIATGVQTIATDISTFFDTSGDIDYNDLKIDGTMFSKKFPFSGPWDISYIYNLFSHDVITPEISSKIGTYNFHVDLHGFDNIMAVARKVELIVFIGLFIFKSRSLMSPEGGDN